MTFEGMKPQPATFTTAEGTTQFVFQDKPYFYVFDPAAVAMEGKHVHGR